ncbi:AraC family transcriptional regulator [bacterium]|nr:AraC family transcriptional regulator [bacterium]
MVLNIKNMVCDRCKKVVKEELEKLGYTTIIEKLGRVSIHFADVKPDLNVINEVLKDNGFELLVEKNSQTIEAIRTTIIDLIYSDKLESLNVNLSDYLAKKLARDYSTLSTLFSSVEGITIEKYFILQKIERVKELLIYDELSLSQTAYRLGYSSVQHLSNQFKKIIGMSPSQFKSIQEGVRHPIDHVGHP